MIDTGNLSLILGIFFILFSFTGVVFFYYVIKNDKVENERLDKFIDLGKWFVVSVALVLSASIVNDGFREREQDIKELEFFDKYVSTVTEADGIEQRWLLCEYFAVVSPKGSMKKAWNEYKDTLEPDYFEFKKNKDSIVFLMSKGIITPEEEKIITHLEDRNNELNKSYGKSHTNEKQWIIIAGGDATIEEADWEVKKVEKLELPVEIYKKGNMFRTVVGPFSKKATAESLLTEIRSEVNSGAYIVDLASWCESNDFNGSYYVCN